jgi:cardiolipin synthase
MNRPGPSHREPARWLAVAASVVLVAGCASASSLAGPSSSIAPPAVSTPPSSLAAGALSLIVEPDQGIAPIDAVLAQARHSLDMVMYELVDTTAEQILVADAARGVAVRVVLDARLERRSNTPAYDYLNAHGVHAVWAPTSYSATHQKSVVIDAGTSGALAVIMTLNLTSRYYSDARDFAMRDTNPADVAAIETAFDANFAGRAPRSAPAGSDLVWSPGSEPALLSLINSATSTLDVENEEMGSPPVIAALEAAGHRGVNVQVTMTRESEWSSAFDGLVAARVHLRTYPDSSTALYIHAKALVVDGRRAFVGSENFSTASLDDNRELGVVTSLSGVINPLGATLASDWSGATPWTG